MADIIQILPDSVANQIAAGEVIQRPSSVVKELVENAVDAGADEIKVLVTDSGKTLIRIIDNGSGMSETDARLAFERHATSKIRKADDLQTIKTFGFRGEALASVAAIAQIELKTRKETDEIGTLIRINGSDFEAQEAVSCPRGSIFSIKNLFFNVPARRRFLKSDPSEFRHILDEFHRIALAHPEISFQLSHNGTEIYNLRPSQLKQRIINIFGKNLATDMLPLDVKTTFISAYGFIGKPENAKKRTGLQFFFVNNRYVRHPALYKTVVNSYTNLLPPDSVPSFFIYFETNPELIDVNIHPTKTEIKFEDEKTVSQILAAAIKQALGKSNIIPSLDFDNINFPDIPPPPKNSGIEPPHITINPDYNPFGNESPGFRDFKKEKVHRAWTELYKGVEKPPEHGLPDAVEKETRYKKFILFKERYIFVPVKSGMMVIDVINAHERILHDYYSSLVTSKREPAEKLIFTTTIQLNQKDASVLRENIPVLKYTGFDISEAKDGSFIIKGIPSGFENYDIGKLLEYLLTLLQDEDIAVTEDSHLKAITAFVKTKALTSGKNIKDEEIESMIDKLFASTNPNYSPTGKPVFHIIPTTEIEKKFS